MALSKHQYEEIKAYLLAKIRAKLAAYNPETRAMPFHYRLLGKDRTALFSFVHSINTTLGQSIFEQVGKIIAKENAVEATAQYKDFSGYISQAAVLKIDKIMRALKVADRTPNKEQEVEELLKITTQGDLGKRLKKRIDLLVKKQEAGRMVEYYFEIKTAKPNTDVFEKAKQQLLEWIVMRASQNSDVITGDVGIKTIIAIPYNPYEPTLYSRWTLQGLFNLEQGEVLVGADFWDLLGGEHTYDDLLRVFEAAGLELYAEIDEKMRNL